MAVSILALIIALCSLLWNIISALRSWRMNRPQIQLATSCINTTYERFFGIKKTDTQSLGVDVQNIGGSSIAITSIYIWWKWENGGERDGDGIGAESGKKAPGVKGPPLPFVIGSYNSQEWVFGDERTKLIIKNASSVKKVLIEVRLATGETVEKQLDLDFYDDETHPRSRTDLNGSRRPRGYVRIRRSCPPRAR